MFKKNRFANEGKTASKARMWHSQIKDFCSHDETCVEMLRHSMKDKRPEFTTAS
jgi:hypothetical protein